MGNNVRRPPADFSLLLRGSVAMSGRHFGKFPLYPMLNVSAHEERYRSAICIVLCWNKVSGKVVSYEEQRGMGMYSKAKLMIDVQFSVCGKNWHRWRTIYMLFSLKDCLTENDTGKVGKKSDRWYHF